eukprot:TRINITY_DN50842_c0_g1_i1.p1 TRINITY_DN50842_c0_g1~~TRINITY_DN50842_c0_g1_i1.p1  ORF type:complete len:294 (-),score=84.57 TRINITY_DN50842_c0_g1_i1:193-1074(-)
MPPGGAAQLVVFIFAIFVAPRVMAVLPDFDPLLMIIGLFGLLAALQQLGFNAAGEGGYASEDSGRARSKADDDDAPSERTPQDLLAEAERCLAQNSWGKVLELSRQVSDADPENARAWELQATALKWEGRREEALGVVEKARSLYEVQSRTLDELAKELSVAESPANAAKEFHEKGEDFVSKRQYDLAAECFRKALEVLGSTGDKEFRLEVLRRSAECAQQLQDWSACRRHATEILDVDPNDTQALLQRAVSNEALEKFKAALEDARKLLALSPKSKAVANRIVHNCQQALRD